MDIEFLRQYMTYTAISKEFQLCKSTDSGRPHKPANIFKKQPNFRKSI